MKPHTLQLWDFFLVITINIKINMQKWVRHLVLFKESKWSFRYSFESKIIPQTSQLIRRNVFETFFSIQRISLFSQMKLYINFRMKSEATNITISMQNWYPKCLIHEIPLLRQMKASVLPLNKKVNHKYHNYHEKISSWLFRSRNLFIKPDEAM